ncbi:hypothetical protein ON010_g3413 [Phytophthora cinnamomi]|nr:hypothetical protein ON010_g3413 [Phytophthora cinnamomi]
MRGSEDDQEDAQEGRCGAADDQGPDTNGSSATESEDEELTNEYAGPKSRREGSARAVSAALEEVDAPVSAARWIALVRCGVERSNDTFRGLSEKLEPAQPRVIQGHTVQDIDEVQAAREEEKRTLQLLVEQEQQSQQCEGQGTGGRSDTSVVIATLPAKAFPQTLALPSIL